jgi:peroxiredoxin
MRFRTFLFGAAIGAITLSHTHAGQAVDFLFAGAGGRLSSLKSLRGQPVVLVIAPDADSKLLRKQIDLFEKDYREFASRGTVFFGALSAKSGRVPSNIPFAMASDGAVVARDYGVAGPDGFLVVVIGPDGSVNARSGDVKSTDWVRSVLDVVPKANP